jgi:hypothetical protein
MKRLMLYNVLLLAGTWSTAQDTVSNNGVLKIHSGASISAFGNLINTSAATLTNNGSLYVKANLVSDEPSMSAGTGTLYLNGGSLQTIGGTGAFKTYSLVTDNAAGILLNADLHVSGSHTFTSGIVSTSSTPHYLVYEAGSSYAGHTDNRHVNGWVKKMGTTDFVFPVGNGTVQRTISINTLAANSIFAVKYAAPTPYTGQLQSPVVHLDANEYWQINEISGGSAKVTLNWDNSKVAFPNWNVPEILVARYDGNNWISEGGMATGNPATTGSITSGTLAAFNLVSFGSSSFTLPVSLLQFDAKRKDDHTQIVWTTTNERRVSHFNVERSDNAVQFYSLSRVPARNSGNVETYTYVDQKPIIQSAYYRLRSIDEDGKESISRIIKVYEQAANNLKVLAVNPVRQHITLIPKENLSGQFDYLIYAAGGQVMQRGKVALLQGQSTNIPISTSLITGSYTLSLTNVQHSIRIKLLVEAGK